MSNGVVKTSGGYKSSASNTTSNSRPPGNTTTTAPRTTTTTAPRTSTSSESSRNISSAHRNPNLLDSYHDFAMHIFGSNHVQDVENQFLRAVENGDVVRVENLLKRRSHEIFNIDVKDKETGDTPIILASKHGHLQITQLLLKYGADITLRNYDNQTAIDVARPNVLRPLVDSVSRVGCSPRHLLQAAWQGNLPTVQRLLSESRILDINCRNTEGFTPLLLVTRDVQLFQKMGSILENYDPLAVVNELLRKRSDPIARDSEGKTALHYAAASRSKLGEVIATTLIQQPTLLEVRDNRSLAPIHSASQSGQVQVVLALLDGGADVNLRGFAGSTPLHVSAYSGQHAVATALLDHGADVTLVDDSGNTAVDVAKTKKLKTTLKEAWTDATQAKQEVVLNPVRAPSRVGDVSSDERSPRDDVSPREKFMLKKFEEAHMAVLAEEQMLRDIDCGKYPQTQNPRRPSFPRTGSAVKTPIPPRTPRVMEMKKPPRSPDKTKTPKRSLSFSTKTKDECKSQKVRGHAKLGYTRSDPTGTGDLNQVPVTVVGLDLDESLRDVRLHRLISGPIGPIMERQHQNAYDRLGSRLSQIPVGDYQSSATLTNPSLTDVTDACNEYMKKGRKVGTRRRSATSTLSVTSVTDDEGSLPWPKKNKSPRKHVLNLEQMHLRRSTPSPMSDSIRMFPNSRFVLPQSPNVSIGETIFEFQNENEAENMLHANTGGSFMASARRLSSGSTGHFSNNTWRLPQTVRTQSTVSEDSTSPENNNEQDMRVESVNTFNIELSRVSPLKESSDSGQGSSRSTGSQGSSFSADSTPSPSTHSNEKDSLVKMSVKNRLGIGMTPAATQVQENSRFSSKFLNPLSRNEEVKDLRRGLVKSVLPTTISISVAHQLGSIPVEKQQDLQPLVSKREFGELDTIKESNSRQTSANSEASQPRTLSGKADGGVRTAGPSSIESNLSRRGSKDDPANKLTVLPKDAPSPSKTIQTNLATDQMNKLAVLPGVKPNLSPKENSDKDSRTFNKDDRTSTVTNKESLSEAKSRTATNEKMVIKKLINGKQQNSSSTNEQPKDFKQTEARNKTVSMESKEKTETKAKFSVSKESSVSDSKSKVEKGVPNQKDTSKESKNNASNSVAPSNIKANASNSSITKNGSEKTSNPSSNIKANASRTSISNSIVTKNASERTSNLVSSNIKANISRTDPSNSSITKNNEKESGKFDSGKTPRAIDNTELPKKAANISGKTETKDSSKDSKTPVASNQQKSSDSSKPAQKMLPTSTTPNVQNNKSVSKPKPDLSSNTSVQKPEPTKVEIKPMNKTSTVIPAKTLRPDTAAGISSTLNKNASSPRKGETPRKESDTPSLLKTKIVKVSNLKTNSKLDGVKLATSPRKLEQGKSSFESAPSPSVSNGKPSLSKSFNSNDKNGIQSELRQAKEDLKKDLQSKTSTTAKSNSDDQNGLKKAKEEIRKESVNNKQGKTTTVQPNQQQKSLTPNSSGNKTTEIKDVNANNSCKNSAVDKPKPSTTIKDTNKDVIKQTTNVAVANQQPNKVNGKFGTTKQIPTAKTTNNSSQANKTDSNKGINPQNIAKKKQEDSKTATKNTSNQKENNNSKKQKVNHVSNSNAKSSKTSKKLAQDNKKKNDTEDDFSDVESMEDVEEMLDNVTFISDEEREYKSEDEKALENVVHIEIKTEEEMKADEPKKVEKKDKLTSKQKLQNKNQTKKDTKTKSVQKSGISGKVGKVLVVNGKTTKSASQVNSKSNKSSGKQNQKTSAKVQQKQSKSAGLISEERTRIEVILTEFNPPKKTVIENTPVITDIMDVIKAVNNGVTPTPWKRSTSMDELSSSPRKKIASPKRSISDVKKSTTSIEKAGSKVKGQAIKKTTNQNKTTKKQTNATKDGFSTESGKKKSGKINPKQLQLLSESERQTTAFITGQGWQIKTDRNETDDVIINDPLETDSSDEEMPDAQLSPHHTMKLQKLNLDKNVINNLATILSPLEGNSPRFLPDTMDTIKEFADSLKSNESEEIAAMLKEGNRAKKMEEGNKPPALPPKQQTAPPRTDDAPKLLPKVSATQNYANDLVGSEGDGGLPPEVPLKKKRSQDDNPPELPPKQSIQMDLPPELPPKLNSSRKVEGFSEHIKEMSVTEPRTDGDGAEDLSYNSYKTNPELLKVFHIPDHYEAEAKSPRLKNYDMKEKESLNLSAIDKSRNDSERRLHVEQSGTDSDVSQKQEKLKALKEEITSKPPLPTKTRSAKKKHLRRINSEPCCLLDTSESGEDDDEVFTPGRNHQSPRKASLPEKSRNASSPRTPRDIKRLTENTALAKYIREKQDAGEMLEETHRLEDLIELDDDEILRKEQLLNEHIQTMTINAMKEFNSLLSPIGEGGESVASTMRPPSSVRGVDDLGDGDLLNRSLPMSEASEISALTVRSEDADTLVSELHSTGSVSSRGYSGSSLISTERSVSSNTTSSEPEGELLHWKKGNLLGRGAFGTVYCGLTSVGQLIAVKQVELSEKDKDKSRKEYETLQEEVQLLKTLRHRNIVGFLGCCLEGSTVNIFMQFIPGGSIASLLARFGALDEPVFCRYTKMILDGTEYLHTNNVIHRDIKGANIMLMSNGVIKLIDFGCAKRLCLNMSQSQNLLRSMKGTPYWMAPEVIMEIGYGKKSDVWSIGCTVFEMALRKPPWSEMPPMPAIFAIGSGSEVPQLPDKFSPEARDFVNACLTRDQNTRPSATELLTHKFIKSRKNSFHERLRRISGSSLKDSQITFKEQPTNRGDSTGSRSRRRESFK